MNWLDPIGASLSLICTYYFTSARRLAWILGIVAIAVNTILYCQKGIYGYLLREAVYLGSMIYGWYQWSAKAPGSSQPCRPIRYLTRKEIGWLTLMAVMGIAIMAKTLMCFNSEIPYWDASTTVLSLMAQWLLCRKIIHCWALWFVVDGLVATLQFIKGIPFHSAIHWLYLILAVVGYRRWKKLYSQQLTAHPVERNVLPC